VSKPKTPSESIDINKRFTELIANSHLREQAKRLMEPLKLIHGTKDARSYDDVVRELAWLVIALEAYPDSKQTACSGGITMARGPMDGYSVHLYATDLFHLHLDMDMP
jgi:hypothetical protein